MNLQVGSGCRVQGLGSKTLNPKFRVLSEGFLGAGLRVAGSHQAIDFFPVEGSRVRARSPHGI